MIKEVDRSSAQADCRLPRNPAVIGTMPFSVQVVSNPWTGGISFFGLLKTDGPYTLGLDSLPVMAHLPREKVKRFLETFKPGTEHLPPEARWCKMDCYLHAVTRFDQGSMQRAVAEALSAGRWESVSGATQDLLLSLHALTAQERLGFWPDNTLMPPVPRFGTFCPTLEPSGMSDEVQLRLRGIGARLAYCDERATERVSGYVKDWLDHHCGRPMSDGHRRLLRKRVDREIYPQDEEIARLVASA